MIGTTIEVLNHGFVTFLDLMPHPASGHNPDNTIVSAARVSFLGDSRGEEADRKLIMRLMRDLHTSPFEQVEFQFLVKAPLLVFWQWCRHRTFHFQSINSQSGRYTAFEEDEFYIPTEWRKQSASNKQGSDGYFTEAENEEFTHMMHEAANDGFRRYTIALNSGMAREQARLFLPGFAAYYKWIVKVDLWNLFHFLRLRLAQDAQYEIRCYAEALYTFVKRATPVAAEAFETYMMSESVRLGWLYNRVLNTWERELDSGQVLIVKHSGTAWEWALAKRGSSGLMVPYLFGYPFDSREEAMQAADKHNDK